MSKLEIKNALISFVAMLCLAFAMLILNIDHKPKLQSLKQAAQAKCSSSKITKSMDDKNIKLSQYTCDVER